MTIGYSYGPSILGGHSYGGHRRSEVDVDCERCDDCGKPMTHYLGTGYRCDDCDKCPECDDLTDHIASHHHGGLWRGCRCGWREAGWYPTHVTEEAATV